MTQTESRLGRGVLMIAHCAGMVDVVSLPVWINTLISAYHFDPQQSGLLATLFLLGAVASSLFFAPRFNRVPARFAAPAGYLISTIAFALLSMTSNFGEMAALHAIAGAAAGCGLSFTHGTIGRSRNPHRLFALAGFATGVFGVLFFATGPQIVHAFGGPGLFRLFSGLMLAAALATSLAFPSPHHALASATTRTPLSRSVWFAMLGVTGLALVQAMTFAFAERVGIEHGFGEPAVQTVLVIVGFVSLVPAPLAALLETRIPALWVLIIAPIVQAALSITITQSTVFLPYAACFCVFAPVMIFSHTFAFGLLARLDPTGRAVAATPAMVMVGAALGPIVGGTLVKSVGYVALGFAAAIVALLVLSCFTRLYKNPTLLETAP